MTFQMNSQILVTGGTGSFGKALIKELLTSHPNYTRIVIYSRDELKQWELQQQYPANKFPSSVFLGDIRDRDRLRRALEGIDTVVHAAALKQVPAAEYNPIEFINTNVLGAENIVQACLDTDVKNVVALSTDKAAAPSIYMVRPSCVPISYLLLQNIKGKRNLRFLCQIWQCHGI